MKLYEIGTISKCQCTPPLRYRSTLHTIKKTRIFKSLESSYFPCCALPIIWPPDAQPPRYVSHPHNFITGHHLLTTICRDFGDMLSNNNNKKPRHIIAEWGKHKNKDKFLKCILKMEKNIQKYPSIEPLWAAV